MSSPHSPDSENPDPSNQDPSNQGSPGWGPEQGSSGGGQYGQNPYGQQQPGQSPHGQQDDYGQYQAAPQYGYGGHGGGYPTEQRRNGLGTAALTLGIIGLVLSFGLGWTVILTIVPLVLGIIALIMGILGAKRVRRGEATNRGAARTGLILGILSIIITLALAILVLTSDPVREYFRCLRDAHGNTAKTTTCEQRFTDRLDGKTPSGTTNADATNTVTALGPLLARG